MHSLVLLSHPAVGHASAAAGSGGHSSLPAPDQAAYYCPHHAHGCHPDDEDGGMMTLEARGSGATVMLFTVNRGEGGQNKFGAETADDLGILRTLELLEADKYYGVEQRFSHVIDFGFSKTAEETFNKWHGHDIALGDMVLAIRT